MNLISGRLANANFRIWVGLFVSALLAVGVYAQGAPQIQVEVGANQQISIRASNVSYGEVLRDLQGQLGWEIEIPALADELKICNMRVEAKEPRDVLAKLLEGSGLGYALVSGANGSGNVKVVVIPSPQHEASAAKETASGSLPPGKADTSDSLLATTQAQSGTTAIQPNRTTAGGAMEKPEAPSTMPLAEAAKAIGAPPGVSPDSVGQRAVFPMSDARTIMGVPPGVSPSDVGRMTTLPISDVAKIMGVPPGVSASDVGKTITLTLSLPTGSGKRP